MKDMVELYLKSGPRGYCPVSKIALGIVRHLWRTKKIDYSYRSQYDFKPGELQEMFPEARELPQFRVNGQNIGGFDEFKKYIEDKGFSL